jgi:hypothetical protein
VWTSLWTSTAIEVHGVGPPASLNRVRGRIVGAVRLENREQGDFGDEAAPAEPDDWKLASGDQLVGERA